MRRIFIIINLLIAIFVCTGFLEAGIKNIQIEGHIVRAEIADTQPSRVHGLMWRNKLDEGAGMLFVFEKPDILSFWMKNTLIPLSIGYFDKDRTLIQIFDMNPGNLDRFVSSSPALYALEVPQGWFAKRKIKAGAKFSFLDEENRVK